MSQEIKGQVVKIETAAGEITLSPQIVRRFLVNGQGNVSDQEVMMFMALCKYQRLNPFLREAYLIKYGNSPASVVVGKEAYLKRARSIKECRGYSAGVICMHEETGEIKRTLGICPSGWKLVGGWAKVIVEGWDEPLEVEVSLDEYIGRTRDGRVTPMWNDKPGTMIRKVALVQALREAFPAELGGMYSQEEIPTADELPTAPVIVDERPDHAPEPVTVETKPNTSEREPGDYPKRSRRNRWAVDPAIFGKPEILTCGATPDQLLALRKLGQGNLKVKAAVKELTGYDQLSYLREDEAAELIARLAADVVDVAPAESDQEPPPQDPDERSEPEAITKVTCPQTGDIVYAEKVCLVPGGCRLRERTGYCPEIDGMPDMEVIQ
jgi:phage recombination protein Bet